MWGCSCGAPFVSVNAACSGALAVPNYRQIYMCYISFISLIYSKSKSHLNLILSCIKYHHLFLSGNKLRYECIYMYVVCIVPAGRGGAHHRRTSKYLMGFASTNQASDAG